MAKFWIVLTFVFASNAFLSVSADVKPHVISGPTMGTYYKVVLYDELSPDKISKARLIIEQQLDLIDTKLSTYKPDSEISRFNVWPINKNFAIGAEFAVVLTRAYAISKLTYGAFDPTVGRAVNLWGFGPDEFEGVPNSTKIDQLKRVYGLDQLDYKLGSRSLSKKSQGVYLDFSAIAKGYAADLLKKELKHAGIRNFLAEIGGEFTAAGKNHQGQVFRVAIERAEEPGSFARVIKLFERSLATSGTYRNQKAGNTHIINPEKQKPIRNQILAVSVVADTSMEADALATAFMVLPIEKGLAIANDHGIPIFYQVRDKDEIRYQTSFYFKNYL